MLLKKRETITIKMTKVCCFFYTKTKTLTDYSIRVRFLPCPEQESNLHTSRYTHLKRTRLPIPPSGLKLKCPGQESNLHAATGTTPSKWRVYQFHHLGFKSAAKILLFFHIQLFLPIFF